MLEKFYPDRIENSTYEIDFNELYRSGKRGIIFDIDNTLVPDGANSDERSEKLFRDLSDIGFKTCLISNNDEERVKRFNKNIGTFYVFKAGKPSAKGYVEGMKKMGTSKKQTIFIGDQLFTDVWGAKRLGMDNICVKPIDKHEEIQIILKRKLERIVFWSYKRKMKHDSK